MLNQIDTFFPVAVGQLVGYLIKGDLLPLAGHIVFDIAGAYFIKVCLAQVMQQAADGVALGAFPLGEKMLHHRIVHIDAVHDKAALTGTVEPGRGRRGEKIRGFQPAQQAVSAGAGDILL